MAGAHGFRLRELVGVLVVEVLRVGVGGGDGIGHFGFHHLVDGHVDARVGLELFDGGVPGAERLVELGLRGKLLLHRRDLGVDVGVGDRELPGGGFLLEHAVGDQLVERPAQHFVAPLRRDRAASGLHVLDQPVEVDLGDVLAVDAREHVGQLGRHRLWRRRRFRRLGGGRLRGRGLFGGVLPAGGGAAEEHERRH